MENKYYTPQLNEFFDGFEYEFFNGNDWQNIIFDFRDLDAIDDEIREGYVRVKLLDKDDIEALGWITEDNGECYDISNGFDLYSLYPYEFEHKTPNIYKIYKHHNVIFYGAIKNKSELKKVMKMIEITN